MFLSIIIVNYHSGHLISDCLHSAGPELMDPDTVEWLVVDNGGSDSDRALVCSEFPFIHWLDMGYNAGFARANNAGMRRANGQVCLLLNPDTLLRPGVVINACHRLLDSTDVAAGVQLIHADGMPQFSGSFFMKGGLNHLLPLPYWGTVLKTVFSLFVKKRPAIVQAGKHQEVDWISGAFLMVKKEAFEKTGGMDESFFLYGEEVEWCSRLGKLGKLALYGDLQIVHLIGQSIQQASGASDNSYVNLSDKKGLQLMVSNHLRIRKQYGLIWFFVQLLNHTFAILFSMVVGPVACVFQGKSLIRGFATWKGFALNVLKLWVILPKMIHPEKYFFKMF